MNHSDTVTSRYGVEMPRLIYGTAWKKERSSALVEQALSLGFRGIDTACQPKHYFEAGVGDGIASVLQRGLLSREQLYLQSKFTPVNGQDPMQIPYDPNAGLSEQVVESFQVSLKNLKTSYLDGLVLHSPLSDRKQLMEVWQTMEGIVANGGARQLGISNCYDPDLFAFLHDNSTIKPAVLQNRFYAETGYDKELRAFCRQQGVIYQSFWTLTANPQILGSKLIDDLAGRYQRTPAQIFFRYLTQTGILPLTGTTSAEHMRQDLEIFQFVLADEECAEIDRLF